MQRRMLGRLQMAQILALVSIRSIGRQYVEYPCVGVLLPWEVGGDGGADISSNANIKKSLDRIFNGKKHFPLQEH